MAGAGTVPPVPAGGCGHRAAPVLPGEGRAAAEGAVVAGSQSLSQHLSATDACSLIACVLTCPLGVSSPLLLTLAGMFSPFSCLFQRCSSSHVGAVAGRQSSVFALADEGKHVLPIPNRAETPSPPLPVSRRDLTARPSAPCRVCRFARGEDAGAGDPAEPAAPRVRRPQPVFPQPAGHGAGGHRCLRGRRRVLVRQPAPGREAALRPADAVRGSRGEVWDTPDGDNWVSAEVCTPGNEHRGHREVLLFGLRGPQPHPEIGRVTRYAWGHFAP